MFEALLIAAAMIAVAGVFIAMDGSRDVFHPLVFIAPMLFFLYCWMPWQLDASGGLERYFDKDQLQFVQRLNVFGIAAFLVACLSVGFYRRGEEQREPARLSEIALWRLLIGGALAGAIGLMCWVITIVNVGGFVNAFSASYAGGWDDSGYVRDGSLLMLVGVLLAVTALAHGAKRAPGLALIALFGLPWISQALLTARRGPTFAFVHESGETATARCGGAGGIVSRMACAFSGDKSRKHLSGVQLRCID
jgi:hypothetical protein